MVQPDILEKAHRANRKGSREGEMEFGNRLKQIPYRNKKKYFRKLKHKKREP